MTTRPIGIPIEAEDKTGSAIKDVEQKVDRMADNVEKDMARASGATQGWRDKLGGLGDYLNVGFAGAAGVAVGAVGAFAASLLNEADALAALSDISGASAEALQEWGYIAEASGGTAEDVADAYREMQLRLSEAANEASGPAVEALDLVGVALEDLRALSPDEQFLRLRDAISAVEDPADRLFAAEELLGGASERLTAALALTGDELANTRQQAQDLAVTMSNETVESLNKAHDDLDRFTQYIKREATEQFVSLLETVGAFDTLDMVDQTEAATDAFEEQEQTIYQLGSAYLGFSDSAGNLYRTLEEGQYAVARSGDEATEALGLYTDRLALIEAATASSVAAHQAEASALHQVRSSAIAAGDAYLYLAQAAGASNAAEAGALPEDLIRQTEQYQNLRNTFDIYRPTSEYAGYTPSSAPTGGGRRTTRRTPTERPTPLRLGDYLVNQGYLDNYDISTIQRYASGDRYGTGANRRINFGRNVAGLDPAELQELVLDVLDRQQVAYERQQQDADERRRRHIAEDEERFASMIGEKVQESLDRTRPPCPPVTIQGSILAERTVEETIQSLQEQVTTATNPLTGAPGVVSRS